MSILLHPHRLYSYPKNSVKQIRAHSKALSKRRTIKQPGWFNRTVGQCSFWRRVLFALCLPSHPTKRVFWRILLSSSHWRLTAKKEYLSLVYRQYPSSTEDFLRSIVCHRSLIVQSRWYWHPVHQRKRELDGGRHIYLKSLRF